MGGLLAQMVAAMTPLAGLALLASAPPRGIPVIPNLALVGPGIRHSLGQPFGSGLVYPFGDDAFLDRLPPNQRADLTARRVPEPRRLAWQLTFWPPAVQAARVTCPIFVGARTDDPVIRPWVTRRVAARYGIAPTFYDGRGHMLNLEPGWQTVATIWCGGCAGADEAPGLVVNSSAGCDPAPGPLGGGAQERWP